MILDAPRARMFDSYLRLCETRPGVDVPEVRRWATWRLRNQHREEGHDWPLERRWYAALRSGAPDWGVYDDDAYLGDLWACWHANARRYLMAMRRGGALPDGRSIVADIGAARVVVDVGCGFGFSTAALAEMFPGARVFGTNLEGTGQMALARIVGERHGFRMLPDASEIGRADVIFASEYFEHFEDPVAHLDDILRATAPRALIVASTFTVRAVGHFDAYRSDGRSCTGAVASRRFNGALRARGYRKAKTSLWNDRPSYWSRGS